MIELLALAKIEKKKIFLMIFFLFFLGLFEILSLSALIPILQLVLNEEVFFNSKYYLIIKDYTSFFGEFGSEINLYFFLILLCIIFFIKNLGMILLTHLNNVIIIGIETKLSIELFKKYISSPIIFLSRKSSSEIIRNVISQSSMYANSFIFSLVLIVTEIFTFSIILIFLFIVNPQETLYAVIIFISISIFYVLFFKKTVINLSQSSENSFERRIRYLNYGIDSAKEIKLYDLKEKFINEYLIDSYKMMRNLKIISLIRVFPRHFFEVIAVTLLSIFIIISTKNQLASELVISKIAIFAYAGFRILPSINRTLTNINRFKISLPIAKNLINEFKHFNNFNIEIALDKKLKIKDFDEFLDFRINGLKFKYPDAKEPIFEKLDFSFKSGSSNFIYGDSGSGKTTLIEIIIGLIQIDEKKIFVNNQDFNNIKNEWQSIVSYVPQNIFIMNDSLRNNIIGNTDLEFRSEDYLNAIKLADLQNLEKTLKDKNIGEKGKKLSSGQIKRIGIARAIYKKNAKVLIFDEATDNLDTVSEIEVIEKIINLKNKYTIIFVSHNITLSKYFNNVFKLEKKLLTIKNAK